MCACRLKTVHLTTVEWAEETNPAETTRGTHFGTDQWVFEWYPNGYKCEDNPGYGKAMGRITDPEGAEMSVSWADEIDTQIQRTNVRLAIKDGATYDYKGSKYTVKYHKLGVDLVPIKDGEIPDPASPPLAKRTRAAKAVKASAKNNARKARSKKWRSKKNAEKNTEKTSVKKTSAKKTSAKKKVAQTPDKTPEKTPEKTPAKEDAAQTPRKTPQKTLAKKAQTRDKTQSPDTPKTKTNAGVKKTGRWRDRQSPKKFDKQWIKCRAKPLNNMMLENLRQSLRDIQVEGWTTNEYYCFALRVMQEYQQLQKSPLHSNKKKVLQASISQVFAQVRPKSSVPHKGDKDLALQVLLPVAVKVIDVSIDF